MDDEIKGEGNSYTTFYRQMDPRLGRWLTVDPITHENQSPYCSMDNKPIMFNDILGGSVDGWVQGGLLADNKTVAPENQWHWRDDVNTPDEAKTGGFTKYADPGYSYPSVIDGKSVIVTLGTKRNLVEVGTLNIKTRKTLYQCLVK